MGLAADQEHDLYLSLENVFLDRMPVLTRIKGTRITSCTRPKCRDREEILSSRSVVMLSPNNITQTTFDQACLAPYDNTCSDEVDITQLRNDTRMESRITEDGVEFFGACQGQRTSSCPTVFSTHPYLLVLDCLQAYEVQSGHAMPVRSLIFDLTNYTLGAIMYSNETHFCCAVFIADLVLLYDGIPRTGTKLIRPVAFERYGHPAGYRPIHIWYLQERHQPISRSVRTNRVDHPTTSNVEAPSLKQPLPSVQPNQAPPLTSSLRGGLRSSRSAPVSATKGITSDVQKSKRHPIGFIVKEVSRKGILPICGHCRKQIQRPGMRFVFTKVDDTTKEWRKSISYHFNQYCMTALPSKYHHDAQVELETAA